ncbi:MULTISPECIES: hypothetical protein [unclassified Micromonospora]|uniref:hypothetical protein n=1 Tax=unclassified Micromonospora TaxID=2617518 RepID=UPI002FF00E5D
MTDWSQLRHAYGVADDVPGLLARAEPDPRSPIWGELWSRLCHQGTVYPASFPALSVLTEIAGRWSAAQRTMPLALAADIVSSEDQPYGDLDPHVTYSCEIARLRALTEETLQSSGPDDDPSTYVYMLQALLAFEGAEVWGRHLDGLNNEEYEVACPQCDEEIFVAFGQYGAFTTLDSMYMNDSGSQRLPLLPADPADLTGVGKRLHDRAIADDHPDVAEKLPYVFGLAYCPACGERFRVEGAITARWSG